MTLPLEAYPRIENLLWEAHCGQISLAKIPIPEQVPGGQNVTILYEFLPGVKITRNTCRTALIKWPFTNLSSTPHMSLISPSQRLVLASTSPFRKEILQKLAIPFDTASPEVDEHELDGESPEKLVRRLAQSKTRAVIADYPEALIIGSDQVACIDGEILGKPGDRQNAMRQLHKASGKTVTFYTGLCLLNARSQCTQVACELFKVHFRQLNEAQIRRYLEHEQPFNCAGSFKSEGMGITLFSKLEGDDPNTLIGLPLIRLVEMLGNEGMEIP